MNLKNLIPLSRVSLTVIAICLSLASGQAHSTDLTSLTVNIPAERVSPIKLNGLTGEIAAQLDGKYEQPYGIVVETTDYTYLVDPRSALRNFHETNLPEIDLPPGDYSLKDLKASLKRQGIDTIFDATASVVYFMQRNLRKDERWAMNRRLEAGTYGIVDPTRCQEILFEQGFDRDARQDDRILSRLDLYKHTMPQIDLSGASTVRELLGAVAVNCSQKAGRGCIVYVAFDTQGKASTDTTVSGPKWVASREYGYNAFRVGEGFFFSRFGRGGIRFGTK